MTNRDTPRYSGAYQHAAPTALPEPWASAMQKAGAVSPTTGEPSIQALYRMSGVHASALSRIIAGRTRQPRGDSIMKIAKALDLPFPEVASWLSVSYTQYLPWKPPEAANLMTPENRKLVESLIHQLVNSQSSDDYKDWTIDEDGQT